MTSILRKFGFLTILFTLFFGLLAPAHAQDALFDDPLEAIKGRLTEENIEVIDYSRGSTWGGLPDTLVSILKDNGYGSLKDLGDITSNEVQGLLDESGIFENNAKKDELIKKAADSIVYATRIQLWGNLPLEVIKILEFNEYTSLEHIMSVAKYDQEIGNINVLIEALEGIFYYDSENGLDIVLTNDDVNLIINEIRFRGESQLNAVILAVTRVLRNLLGGIAIIWIVIAGIRMIMASGNEEKIKEQKSSIIYAVIGLVIILILERLIVLIYGVQGMERGLVARPEGLSEEILGVVSFIKALIGSIAILMIMISGIKTIAAVGEEEKIAEQRKSILWIIVGIVIIVINQVIVENLYIQPVGQEEIKLKNVENIIALIGKILQFALGFVGLIAFAALIYGAASMITNYGNDESVEKGKKIIKNAIVGIIVIISAFAIVSTMML